MVESQVRPNGITDHRIIDAMAAVKREDFVPPERKTIAYLDEDVQLKEGRFLIEPMAFARMIHLALIKPQFRPDINPAIHNIGTIWHSGNSSSML